MSMTRISHKVNDLATD